MRALPHALEQRLVIPTEWTRTIEHEHGEMRLMRRRARSRDAFGLHHVAGIAADTGGVHQRDRDPVDVDRLGQQIARRAGDFGDDRAAGAGERIEQRRLARVWAADDHDLRPFAHEPSGTRVAEQRVDRRGSRAISSQPRPGSTK